MVITTVSFNEATHYRLRHLALDKRLSLRDVIRAAITDYLAREDR